MMLKFFTSIFNYFSVDGKHIETLVKMKQNYVRDHWAPIELPPPIIMWISMNFFDLFTLHNAFFTVFHRMRVCICFFGAKQCVAQYKLSAGIICYGLYIRVVYIFITKALHNTHRVLCLWRAMSNFCLLISDDDDDDENLLWKARKLIWLKF